MNFGSVISESCVTVRETHFSRGNFTEKKVLGRDHPFRMSAMPKGGWGVRTVLPNGVKVAV
jgi:hypothetical protein